MEPIRRINPRESAAQIPNSGPNALTLSRVTSQSNDAHWQRPGESAGADPGTPRRSTPGRPRRRPDAGRLPGRFRDHHRHPVPATRRLGPAPVGRRIRPCSIQQEPLPYVQPQPAAAAPGGRSPPRSMRPRRRAGPRRRPARHPESRFAGLAGRARGGAGRARAAEAVRLVGRPGHWRLQELAVRCRLPARRHPDLRERRRRDRRRCAAGAGAVHPAGRRGCAGVPDQRAAGRRSRRRPHRGILRSSCRRGTNTRSP